MVTRPLKLDTRLTNILWEHCDNLVGAPANSHFHNVLISNSISHKMPLPAMFAAMCERARAFFAFEFTRIENSSKFRFLCRCRFFLLFALLLLLTFTNSHCSAAHLHLSIWIFWKIYLCRTQDGCMTLASIWLSRNRIATHTHTRTRDTEATATNSVR